MHEACKVSQLCSLLLAIGLEFDGFNSCFGLFFLKIIVLIDIPDPLATELQPNNSNPFETRLVSYAPIVIYFRKKNKKTMALS